MIYNLACAYGLRCGASADKAKRDADAAQAIATLKEAVKAGYANVDHMEQDGDLVAIRGEAGYKAIIAELRARQPKK